MRAAGDAVRRAMPRATRPSSRAAYLFRASGAPVPRADFAACLAAIDAHLAAAGGGPFLAGAALSAADVAWVPFLERFARPVFDSSPHGSKIDVKIGDALANLKAWPADKKFDMVFVDVGERDRYSPRRDCFGNPRWTPCQRVTSGIDGRAVRNHDSV